jgi:hypothetical protein
MKLHSRSAIMSFRALRLRSGQAPRGIHTMQLRTRTIRGIPRHRTPRSDMIAGKMNSHMIQTQPDIGCYVSFPHTLEKILLKDFMLSGIPDDKQ